MKLLWTLVLLSLSITSASASASKQVVSPLASEIGTKRIDAYLFRYVFFNTESYACLRVELLDLRREGKEIVVQKEICEYEGKDFSSYFSYVGFQQANITKDAFTFSLNTMLRGVLGDYYQKCTVKINGEKNSPMLSPMTCAEPVERIYND